MLYTRAQIFEGCGHHGTPNMYSTQCFACVGKTLIRQQMNLEDLEREVQALKGKM